MVLHPKKKSKRQTTRHRAKVTRKVREHDRKQRKNGGANGKKKQKDPGVPSSFPQKETFIRQLEHDRQEEKEHRQRNRTESERLQEMLKSAEERDAVFRKLGGRTDSSASKVVAAVQDSSRKSYFREFNKVVESSDVILQVLDARDPQGCRDLRVEEAIREAGKKLVLVLNKTDLVPTPVVKSWLAHLRRFYPTVAFKASVNSQKSNLGAAGGLTANDAMGADQLIGILKNYSRSLDIKTAIVVGVVGYPNVGKSSLINSLKRAKVCKVGGAPGVTTTSQYVHLDRNITLLDCPGIVFSTESEAVFLRNVLKVEQLEDPIAPVSLIMKRVPKEQLIGAFACSWTSEGLEAGDERDTMAFLRAVALSHGRMKRGGVPDLDQAARYVLNEWNAGKIKYWTEPPTTGQDTANDSCAIVNELSAAFTFDDAWLNQGDTDTVME